MLDIVMPVPVKNAALAPDAISELAKCTDHPFKLLVVVDGGVPNDFTELQACLNGFDHEWKLSHNNPAVGLNQTIMDGLQDCRQKITAIIAPQIRLMDPAWVGKIKQIFDREPITGIIDTAPNTKSATMYPIKRAHNRHPLPGCRFMVVQTAFAKKTPLFGEVDPAEFWSRMASSQAGSAWHAAGVRYTEVEHEEHELKVAPLGVRS